MWNDFWWGVSDIYSSLLIFRDFCHHILNLESLAFPLQTGPSEPSEMTSPPTQPIRQLNRALPLTPRPLQGLSLPYFWGAVKNRLPPFLSLPCFFASRKIDWGNGAAGRMVFRLWRLCKMARGGKCREEKKKKKSHLLIIPHKWCCWSFQASAPCQVVCVRGCWYYETLTFKAICVYLSTIHTS